MSRIAAMLALGLLAGLSAVPSRVEAQSTGARFMVAPELLAWTRTGGDTPHINVVGPGDVLSGGERLFTFEDLPRGGYRLGGALNLGYRLDEAAEVWLRGFYVAERERKETLCPLPNCPESGGSSTTFSFEPGNATTTNNTRGGFIAFTAESTTNVWGVEANYDRTVSGRSGGPQIRLFGGPRFIQFRDEVEMRFFESKDDFEGSDDDIQEVDILVVNNLIGAQVGVEGRVPLNQAFSVGARVSGGLFANVLERERRFEELQTGLQYRRVDDRTWTRFAQAIEATIALTWRFMPGWAASIGYQVLFLNDVSVAPRHFRTVAVPGDSRPRADSAVVFHGALARVGVEF